MKIDNAAKTASSAALTETRSRQSKPAADGRPAGAAAEVQLSSLSSQMQSFGEPVPIDGSKVAEIKQAIAEGRFRINADAIAGRLVETAQQLIQNQRAA